MMNHPGDKVVWIVGGGSGIGRATSVQAASTGWKVVLSGRRMQKLRDTAEAISGVGVAPLIIGLDVADPDGVLAAASTIRQHLGRLDALVVAAGENAPQRRWDDQSMNSFSSIVDTNLTGVARVLDAALPLLRESSGMIVLVSSYSGWTFSPSAGVAYSASKTAIGSLARTVNSQEATSGVRACHLCPGDVATDFLEMRHEVPDEAARSRMLQAADVARAITFVLDSPAHVRFDELVISPLSQH